MGNLKTKYFEAVAPGQSNRLAMLLSDDEESYLDDTIDENLRTMKAIFDASVKFGKLVAISMVYQQFSKTKLVEHFQCLKRKVDQARSLQLISVGIQLPKNKLHTRALLNIA